MTWRTDIQEVVEEKWRKGVSFTLREVYTVSRHLQRRHPGNGHLEAKIRQILQELRDDGIIQFVDDRGTYRRLK
jgi:type II restriction enzyme